ncbi:MAG TPA: hypothetical protein DCZ94_15010 [Lentisphaeria bacterium]|nr:MAG: hypothetical protein A2X48_03165 [Lentisphaerae bacterium GWF2_49_21]HBC88259.1 hypothetical protein [Lentisphaeria bacterium]
MLTKLTLSAEKDVVEQARRLARKNRTSISSMFSRFIRNASRSGIDQQNPIAPITKRASGIASLKNGKTDKELLEEALSEKYGIK